MNYAYSEEEKLKPCKAICTMSQEIHAAELGNKPSLQRLNSTLTARSSFPEVMPLCEVVLNIVSSQFCSNLNPPRDQLDLLRKFQEVLRVTMSFCKFFTEVRTKIYGCVLL